MRDGIRLCCGVNQISRRRGPAESAAQFQKVTSSASKSLLPSRAMPRPCHDDAREHVIFAVARTEEVARSDLIRVDQSIRLKELKATGAGAGARRRAMRAQQARKFVSSARFGVKDEKEQLLPLDGRHD